MIKLERVNKYFNRRKRNQIHIINNTSLEIENNGLVAILGQSGSGKTTLLNVIGGLDKVNKGKIFINGKKITRKTAQRVDKIRNLNIGYIFQDYKLLENMSVYENVAISLRLVGIKNKKEIKKRVDSVLEAVNMYRYRNRPCKMLSGGEKQRVAIARAIAKNPNIVIADEPTGNLDSKNSLEIMNIIKAISKEKLVILVTHEVNLAKFYASRIIEIQDGKITKDYKNEITESLDYRLDNKIYLKDFKNIDKISNEKFDIDVYSDSTKKLDIKLIVKNGNMYIESKNQKIEVIDENSAVELVDDHYKQIDKSFYQEYEYNLNNAINKSYKPRYSSIFGISKSIISGFKKISNYSVMKKCLLLGFLASSMFIVYAVTNIAGITNIKDRDFITKTKDYLTVEIGKINVDDYSKYESLEDIDYILPGDSIVNFKLNFDDYYQVSRDTLNISGSLTALDLIDSSNIICGRMPENEYELVLDKLIVDKLIGSEMGNFINGFSAKQLGLRNFEELLSKKVSLDNINSFTIVGFVDENSPSIYVNKSLFINILKNSKDNMSGFSLFYNSDENDADANIMDYNLALDDITLKKGRFPTQDYEVIVNISNQYNMKLNKTISKKINDRELKVVGYYESKTNKDNYLVSPNTVKYSVISKKQNITVFPKDKEKLINKLKYDYNLNVTDTYEKDRENYVNERKEQVLSSVVFAGIILVISLVEIYLMIRSSFLSRIKEIGILRAIGVKKMDIYRMFLGEILAITTVGSMPGIILMSYILNGLTKIQYIGKMFVVNFVTVGISILIIYMFNIIIGLMPLFGVLRKTPAKILSRHDVE